MVLRQPSPAQLYRLILLSLSWLRESQQMAEQVEVILQAMMRTGAILDLQHVGQSAELSNFMLFNAFPTHLTSTETVGFKNALRTDTSHLLVIVPRDRVFAYNQLLGPSGFEYAITDAGVLFVKQKSPDNESVTRDMFIQAWKEIRTEMEGDTPQGA
jgi:hypothetical protein